MSNHVKKLAIGTAQFGMPYGIANKNGQVSTDEVTAILDIAWQNGIDTLDTAKSYGNSEELLGNYIKQHPECSWKIITKIGENRQNVDEQFHHSIKKLTVSPTMVLAHSTELFLNKEFQLEFVEASEKYSINKIGVSLYSEDEINRAMESALRPEVIQLPLNILDTKLFQRGVLANISNNGIEVHARSAFLQGLFYLLDSEIEKRFNDALPFINKLKSIAAETYLTLPELSLLWLVNLDEISKVIIGVDSAEQLNKHLVTLNKKVDPSVFEVALSVNYQNENILNPSVWH